jgi:hypothetical protein
LTKYGENRPDTALQMRARPWPCCALRLVSGRFRHIYCQRTSNTGPWMIFPQEAKDVVKLL